MSACDEALDDYDGDFHVGVEEIRRAVWGFIYDIYGQLPW